MRRLTPFGGLANHLQPLTPYEHSRETARTVGSIIRTPEDVEAAKARGCNVGRVELKFLDSLVRRIRELDAALGETRDRAVIHAREAADAYEEGRFRD